MNFSEYKDNFFATWRSKLLIKCWTMFGVITFFTFCIAIAFYLTQYIPRHLFIGYVLIEVITPMLLQLLLLMYSTFILPYSSHSFTKKNNFIAWVFVFQASIVSIFHARVTVVLLMPTAGLILASFLSDRKLLRNFFIFNLICLTCSSVRWLICFAGDDVINNVCMIISAYLYHLGTYLIARSLCKSQYSMILFLYKNVEKQKKLNRELRREPLTRLYNRTAYAFAVDKYIRLFNEETISLAMVVIDLDNFKMVNDKYGHSGGDAVLIYLGEIINKCVKNTGMAFRYGGDEFVILFKDKTITDVKEITEKIHENFCSASFDFMNKDEKCTFSAGISFYRKGENSKQWFTKADSAAYCAKANGKNCIEVAND